MSIAEIAAAQREYFLSGKTLPVGARLAALKRLRQAVQANTDAIAAALKSDLNKAPQEAYMTEIGLALDDMDFCIKHIEKWARPVRVPTPLSQFCAKSVEYPEPYGCALIMSPWNYPFLLSIEPLTGAVAAGCTAVLKPSAYAPATSKVIKTVVSEAFPEGYVCVIEGGRSENSALLDEKWEYIFFTGSVEVGRLVMEKASRHLTPVSLELGGKSPVIIDRSADVAVAARRVAFGKCINAGQTCVAPDYVYVHSSLHDEFIRRYKDEVTKFFPNNDFSDMPVIVNEKHLSRVIGLAAGAEAAFYPNNADASSQTVEALIDIERRFVPPLIIPNADWATPAMGEEIFAPILPVLPFNNIEDAISEIRRHPKPLALYLFARDNAVERDVLSRVSFGGGCVNDTIIHLCSNHLRFGGVGESGMGSYHGKKSFDTFTHYKSVVKKALRPDLSMRYHPYSAKSFNIVKRFM